MPRISNGGQTEVCHSDNGRLLLNGDVKILGNITTRNSKTFYVSKTNELNFLCYKINDSNNTKIFFNDNKSNAKGQPSPAKQTFTRLVDNNKGTNKEPVEVECDEVCRVTIVVISFNASEFCISNGNYQLSTEVPQKIQ